MLEKYGVKCSKGTIALTPEQAEEIAKTLDPTKKFVLKS